MDKVRLGIIGAGRLGSFHASKAANNSEVELVGISDPFEPNRKRIANQHNIRDFATIDELLPHIDAVVVAAPSTLHAEIGRQVLLAGKHLLIEKPVTTTATSALELANIARSKNLVMQVGHVEQYNPAWRAVLTRLQDARSGRVPVMIEATRTSGYTFRCADVGVVLDLMIHDLELILSLIPSTVERVSAFGLSQVGEYEDSALVALEFANGSMATLKASRVEQTPTRRMTITMRSQTATIDFAARSATIVSPKQSVLNGRFAPDKTSFVSMGTKVQTFMTDEYEKEVLVCDPFDALELEMQNFVSAILRDEESTVPGERAARAVAVAESIVQDIQKKK